MSEIQNNEIKKIYSDNEIADILVQSNFNKSLAARNINKSRSWLIKVLDKRPEIKNILRDMRNEMVSRADQCLKSLLEASDEKIKLEAIKLIYEKYSENKKRVINNFKQTIKLTKDEATIEETRQDYIEMVKDYNNKY